MIMKKKNLTDIRLQRMTLSEDLCVSKSRLVEDVESIGLDPDVYIGAIEGDLGKAGVVNLNGRIYQVGEFVEQNNLLQKRLESGEFVDGELGHPDSGSTFDVAARLLSVETVVEGNTARASGVFAILSTVAGRDLMTLYRAGMNVGVSSRGTGIVERMVLDEESEYSEANPSYIGRSVSVVSEFDLETYDLVRVPSAGTYVKRERQDESELAVEAVEELEMSDQQVEIVEEAPAAANNVQAESDPLAGLDNGQKEVLLKIVEAVKVDNPKEATDGRLAKEVSALREQLSVDRERSKINEAEYISLREEVESLRKERDDRILADNIASAIEESVEGKRFSGLVRKELNHLVESSTIASPEAIAPHAERLFAMLNEASTPVVEPVVQEVVDAEDDTETATVEESVENAPIENDLSSELLALLNKNRA